MPDRIIDVSPTLTQLRGDVSLASFCPEGFVDIGVSISTDAFKLYRTLYLKHVGILLMMLKN